MPLYEFKCSDDSCANIQENIQGFDDPPPPCKKCNKETRRQISNSGGVGFNFKGSGWYVTDYPKSK